MRKGFTLIEMIAILIILAAITLVVFPALNNMIKNAQISNDKQIDKNIIDDATAMYDRYLIKGIANTIIDKDIYNLLEVQSKPETGHVMINEYGDIKAAIKVENKCYKKAYNSSNINLENDENCDI